MLYHVCVCVQACMKEILFICHSSYLAILISTKLVISELAWCNKGWSYTQLKHSLFSFWIDTEYTSIKWNQTTVLDCCVFTLCLIFFNWKRVYLTCSMHQVHRHQCNQYHNQIGSQFTFDVCYHHVDEKWIVEEKKWETVSLRNTVHAVTRCNSEHPLSVVGKCFIIQGSSTRVKP